MRKDPLFLVILLILSSHVTLPAAEDDSLEKARNFFQDGAYEEALEHFERAAKSPSHGVEARIGWARVLMEKGEYVTARRYSDEALNMAPKNPSALNLKGDLLKLIGRYGEAREHYQRALTENPDHLAARLNLGVMQWEWGEKDAARQTLDYFIRYYRGHSNLSGEELGVIAQACVYLDRFRDANNLFYDATKGAPRLWQVYLSWGNLFLSKHNVSDAVGVFEDALKINPNASEALLGLAKSFLQSSFEKANTLLDQALDINPNLIEAHNLKAEMEIAGADYDAALEKLETPLRVNPNALSTRVLRAVSFYFANRNSEFEQEEADILSVNPRYGELYFQLGEHHARRYLFKESVDYYNQALSLDPEHAGAQAGLGTSLSRLGSEQAAKEVLERAFKKDPYNKYVGNLLTLFDEYPQYKTHEAAGGLVVRMHEKDNPVLSKYAVELANEGFLNLSEKYNFDQTQEVLLEIFPEHDDFAVRCFGLPGAQAFLGICFGNVVAMDSPRARTKGDFVWGETLWHELVHVSHLRMTDNRIPRWLAEGIAVYETSAAKPHWSMNLDLPFIQALMQDQILPLDELDSGFNRPTSPGQVSLSYYQASKVIGFLVETYGHRKIVETFPKFRDGLATDVIFKSVFGRDLKTLDEEFRAHVKKAYNFDQVDFSYNSKALGALTTESRIETELESKPNNPFVNFHAGIYFKEQGEFERALPLLAKARKLFPNYVMGPNPYEALVEVYLELGDKKAAVKELKTLTARNGKDPEGLKLLASLCLEVGDTACAVDALTKVLYISPFESDVHKRLAAAYLAKGEFEGAIQELQILLKTEPQDLAGAHCDLANAYLKAGRKAEAKASALTALEIAPNYDRAQEILLACLE